MKLTPYLENQSKLKSAAEITLDLAKKSKVTGAEIYAEMDNALSVSVRMGKTETVEHCFEKNISIKVYFGKNVGVASTSELDPKTISLTFEKACYLAKFTNKDPCAGLPDQQLLAYEYPDLNLNHPWDISTKEAISKALECEKHALDYKPELLESEGSSLDTHQNYYFHANTLGFSGHYSTTAHTLSCSLLAKQKNTMQRDSDYTIARDYNDLNTAISIAHSAAKKTLSRLNARSLSTRKAPIIFSADIAKSLIRHFTSAISGSNLFRKSSFLLDHLGKQIFPKHIQIDQRPHLLKEMGSAPFDSDGVKTTPRFYVKNGILESYILNIYSARQLKMETTGNAGGTHNLFINSGEDTLDDLLKKMNTGLLVTELIGHGVNLVNGDYSRGAFGYWVENGEILYPVEEITIAGNLKNMLNNIIAVANNIDYRGNIKTGSILIEEMTIAGND